MHPYRAPLRDIRFVLHEVLHAADHYAALGRDDVTADLMDSILEECARFAEEVVAPTNAVGDVVGVRWHDGEVAVPPGFREAYERFVADGWAAVCGSAEYGGQGMPAGIDGPIGEMLVTANMAWKMYSGLTDSAILALEAHARASSATCRPSSFPDRILPTTC